MCTGSFFVAFCISYLLFENLLYCLNLRLICTIFHFITRSWAVCKKSLGKFSEFNWDLQRSSHHFIKYFSRSLFDAQWTHVWTGALCWRRPFLLGPPYKGTGSINTGAIFGKYRPWLSISVDLYSVACVHILSGEN